MKDKYKTTEGIKKEGDVGYPADTAGDGLEVDSEQFLYSRLGCCASYWLL